MTGGCSGDGRATHASPLPRASSGADGLFPGWGLGDAGVPSRPDHRHGCRDPTASTERSGNVGTGPGGGSRSGRDGATTDGGEGFGVTGVNSRAKDDRLAGRGGTRALPRSRRHTRTDRLRYRVGGEEGEGKDLVVTFGDVTGRDGGRPSPPCPLSRIRERGVGGGWRGGWGGPGAVPERLHGRVPLRTGRSRGRMVR